MLIGCVVIAVSKMKIKEVEQTANIAWSPASQYPIYLATGTAAQQLDASFSTTSQIDLYSLDLNEPGLGMGLKASISTKQRYIQDNGSCWCMLEFFCSTDFTS